MPVHPWTREEKGWCWVSPTVPGECHHQLRGFNATGLLCSGKDVGGLLPAPPELKRIHFIYLVLFVC